ncbi:sigma-54 interaction domain-containing protein [Cytobacillus kochii]
MQNSHAIRNEQLFNKIIDELPLGVMILNHQKEILFCNQRLLWMMDGDENEMTHLLQQDFILSTIVKMKINKKELLIKGERLEGINGAAYMYLCALSNEATADLLPTGQGQQENEMLIEDILEYAYDGLVLVDAKGYVVLLTQAYAEFLKVDQKSSIGKHVTEVIENTRMHIVVKTGKQEAASLQKVNGGYMIATRSPIFKNGKVVGAVGKLLFKNVGQFSALFKRLHSLEKELKKYKGDFRESNKASYSFHHLIGESPAFKQVKAQAVKVAENDSNVLLLGESGTGKELFAHAIHQASSRGMGLFVKVNCAAIPAELIESELFGYEEGAFTGARKGGKAGKFETADGGTIFLDEIGELPIHMQVKLLRVLQEKEVERVGSTNSKAIDVRIIAATNRNLEDMVDKGEFRLDLYYRLKVMEITIPSLKDRKEDVSRLSHYFTEKYATMMAKPVKGIDEKALHILKNYHWPGNIRELENVIERAMNMVDLKCFIEPKHLSANIKLQETVVPTRTLAEVMEETEKQTIIQCLTAVGGKKTEAAKRLGISRTTLYEKMNKYHLLEE